MSKFATEYMGKEYNGDALQREIESIYTRLNNVEGMAEGELNALRQRFAEIADEVASQGMQLRQNMAGNQSVMPLVDSDTMTVSKFKLIPLVTGWWKPIEFMKYPHVLGYQVFASPEYDFEPLIESSLVDLEGTAGTAHATDLIVSAGASPVPGLGTTYKNMPFWSDMSLTGKKIMNTTTGDTGSITLWQASNPLVCQGTGIAWTEGDGYRIYDVPRPRNLIGQGPLPFAIKLISAGFNLSNPLWDGKSYYMKVRTMSRGLPKSRRYGQFVMQGTLPLTSGLPAPTVTASPFFYLNHVTVKWTQNWTYAGQGFNELDHWAVYRTTANDTALCDDETYIISDDKVGVLGGLYIDHGYDATEYPTGPEPDTTYYYWVRGFDKDGNKGTLSSPDNAILGVAADPIIDSVDEESTTNFFGLKNYNVVWTCAGGAEGYKIKRRLKLNGTYGIWTPAVIVNHTTDYGLLGGEDKQQYTFHALQIGKTYTVAIQAIQNWQILGLNSNWVTQDFTVTDSVAPDPPT